MSNQVHEAAANAVDRVIDAADYIVDLLTVNDPVQIELHTCTHRVLAAEGTILDKLYDITNKGRND